MNAPSGRQAQILAMVADGFTNAQIATRLHMSERSVSGYLTRLFRYLGARDRAHAVKLGFQAGLLDFRLERDLQPHGTVAAYQRHRYHGEDPCAACREAVRVRDRVRKRAERRAA